MGMTTDQYLLMLQALLPHGSAWPREPDAVLTKTLQGLADEVARVDLRAENLLDEVDPRTTSEMLLDWERIAGLPDLFSGDLDTVQERREALVTKLTNVGGQSRAFFIALAARLGYTITITEFRPFRVGVNAAGDALNGGPWNYTWQVNAPETTIKEFRCGQSAVGEALRSWGNDLLESAISTYKPAHTHVIFAYS
jgi:uncharacterized protein YmfQ (DUF2313 family)